jgi:iron complex transport system substrate-binding protein
MRVFAFVWAASLALLAAPAGAAPQRVASLNLCTDELLLMLGQPDQIASVTHLSHKPAETILWRRARRYPLNDGSLLSVARLRPDLVLTMGGGGGDKIGHRASARLPDRRPTLPPKPARHRTEHRDACRALGPPRTGPAAAPRDCKPSGDSAQAADRYGLARRRRPQRRRDGDSLRNGWRWPV